MCCVWAREIQKQKWAIVKYRLRPAPDIFSSWLESARSIAIKCLFLKSKPQTDSGFSLICYSTTLENTSSGEKKEKKSVSCPLKPEYITLRSALDQKCFRNEGMEKWNRFPFVLGKSVAGWPQTQTPTRGWEEKLRPAGSFWWPGAQRSRQNIPGEYWRAEPTGAHAPLGKVKCYFWITASQMHTQYYPECQLAAEMQQLALIVRK